MGSETSQYSQEQFDSTSLNFYYHALRKPCLLPDVGIDESLLKYSGTDSNAVLQAFSKEMLNTVPGYVGRLGSVLAPMTSVPNAVGLGALVISLIIEIIIKSSSQPSDNTYSMLRRVFGEEKASSVRDTMSEFLGRHRTYMNNDQRLREELRRLEQQLSNHLTILRNSLLLDGQMSSRGFKIWVNGAAFHVQMLIHEARLNIQTGTPASDHVDAIDAVINLHSQYLEHLLEKYKIYKSKSNFFKYTFYVHHEIPDTCIMENNEIENCNKELSGAGTYYCTRPEREQLTLAFMNHVYSNYEPIKVLKSYFLNIKNNLNSLIHERGSFTVPSAAG